MRRIIVIAAAAASLGLGAGACPARAQDTGALGQRVDRLEGEMRAVQRKVFPGGAGRWVQPEITPAERQGAAGPGSSNPVADLTVRVNSLEMQLSSLTNEIEQSRHDLRVLRDEFEAYKKAHADAPPVAAPIADTQADAAPDAAAGGAPDTGGDGLQLPESAGGPSRADRVAAVERPDTGDRAEDAYVYGYRLWMAKFYPEAEQQLKSVVEQYPQHRRASFAQNLLGRAYLDEGKPSLASIAFYENYKKMPDGARAPDSLYYLAQALMQLKKPADACKVYGELSDVYADRISADMRADIAAGRARAGCK